MYEQFKDEVLLQLHDMEPAVLQQVVRAMDVVSIGYTISAQSKELAVVGRERFLELAATYTIVRKTEGLSSSTIDLMVLTIKNFVLAVNIPVEEIKANDIRAYLYRYQAERGVTNRTLEQMRIIICGLFRWLHTEGYIPTNPCENVKAIKYAKKPRKALSQKELELVRMACKSDRDTAITEFLYSTGCRVSEMCGVRLSDIDWANHEVMVLGKGSKYRRCFLNAKCEVALERYLTARSYSSDYLFTNHHGGGQISKWGVEQIYREIQDKTAIRITPHILRHTFATQALTGTGVEVVQKLLGHSSIATTMVYAEVNVDAIKSAHARCVI